MSFKSKLNWKVVATRILAKFHHSRDINLLKEELFLINPFPLATADFSTYRFLILENLNAFELGDENRFSLTSSKSILHLEYFESKAEVFEPVDPISVRSVTDIDAGLFYIHNDIDILVNSAKSWLKNLIVRYNDYHNLDVAEFITLPHDMRRAFKITKDTLLNSGASNKVVVPAKIYQDCIVSDLDLIISFEDMGSRLFILDLVYYLDKNISLLFNKTPYTIIEKTILEALGSEITDDPRRLSELVDMIIYNLKDHNMLYSEKRS